MHRQKRKLSVDDQQAIDVVLDAAASAETSSLTKITTPVCRHRLTAATKWLSLLSELPNIEPPAGLAARTIQFVDESVALEMGQRSATTVTEASSHLH